MGSGGICPGPFRDGGHIVRIGLFGQAAQVLIHAANPRAIPFVSKVRLNCIVLQNRIMRRVHG